MGCALINWREYNNALVQRGDFTIYIPLLYSDFAFLLMGTIQQLCLLPLRQTQGFVKALFSLANKVIPVPNYTTLCRRRRKIEIPKVNRRGSSFWLLRFKEDLSRDRKEEWKDKIGYHRRNAIESFISQLKRSFGGVVRARSPAGQRSEIGIRIALLNQ